jgi:SOS-response transcriptional repressor LexA
MNIHEKLAYLVKQKGRGAQARLAETTNDERSTINKWITGKQSVPKSKLKTIADFFGVTVDYLLDDTQEKPITRYVPKIGVASCGVPTTSFFASDEYVPVPPGIDPEGVYAVEAIGDSMFPKISEGETIFCNTKRPIHDGDIVHYTFDGESGIKVFRKSNDGGVMLLPVNQECDGCAPIAIPKNRLNDLSMSKCVGVYKLL